jgi:hypothetical protein
MTLKEQLNNAMKAAMKARDNLRLSAVRMVRAAVTNREIDARTELDDQAVIDVISTMAKQRRESIRMYREGNRPELAEKEELELAIILEFRTGSAWGQGDGTSDESGHSPYRRQSRRQGCKRCSPETACLTCCLTLKYPVFFYIPTLKQGYKHNYRLHRQGAFIVMAPSL